jgi:REP element-mobilizing transposase RayT
MEAGKIYHVYNRGVNKHPIFFDDENYSFFLRQFNKYLGDKVDTLAYCLMPNHFHLLIRVRAINGQSEQEIGKAVVKSFRDFLISYAKAVNKKYNRTGALFQQKFKRKEITTDAYFSWIVQYIHLNPVKAGLCNEPGDWKYSSYNAIVSKKQTKICVEEVLVWFGGLDEFIRIHRERVLDDIILKQFLKDDY